METCSVRWRSSGGRGEFEYVPAETLEGRNISVLFDPLGVTIDAEVRGVKAQGKPRLRKRNANDRKKFHLPQLVMAVARLPDPAREDRTHVVSFPLENKSFVLDAMEFDIIHDDGMNVILAPLLVSIRNSKFQINLKDRLHAVATDIAAAAQIGSNYPDLGTAITEHAAAVAIAINDTKIRKAADEVIRLQQIVYGMTNVGSITTLQKAAEMPPTEIEEVTGQEGKIITRIHVFKERDRSLVKKAKNFYKGKNGGKLVCVACGLDPVARYGKKGEVCIEAHHKIPIEELQPDSVTRVADLAMVCASCHRIIHSEKPCLTVDEVCSAITGIAAAAV